MSDPGAAGGALELRSVSAGYPRRPVLTEVSASVRAGCWLGIIGANGTGKSTLLKAVAGLLPYRGSIAVHGAELAGWTNRQRARVLGYAPQNPAMPDGLSVADYVLLGRTPHLGMLARESDSDLGVVADALAQVDLDGFGGRPLRTLSGGERQRAVLARALAQQADVLLLDEPTTGLDVGHAQALLDLVDARRTADGVTVVSTLHDLTLAAQYPELVLLLDAGRVAAFGTPAEVLTAQRLRAHYDARIEVLTTSSGNLVVTPYR